MSCVPLPWWTSQSRIATRSSPSSACACARGDRDVVEEAEAHRPVGGRVVPGRPHEREAAGARRLDRAAGGEQRRLEARLRASVSPSSQVGRVDAADPGDVLGGMAAFDLLDGRRLASVHGPTASSSTARRRGVSGWCSVGWSSASAAWLTTSIASASKPAGQVPEAPALARWWTPPPSRAVVGQGGERGRGVHRRYSPVEQQLLPLRREPAGVEHRLQRAVLGEQRRRRLRADALRARELVGRVAAQGDEVRHLLGLDAVSLAHLAGPDPRELGDALDRLEDGRPLADELERVAVGGGDERLAAACLLLGDRGGEEIVRLVARLLPGDEPERPDELRQEVELLEQLGVEDAAALVGGEAPPGGRSARRRSPTDHHRARLLGFPEAEQEVREADERARGQARGAPHRLRQRVVGAVGERVAVDREQRASRGAAARSARRSAPSGARSRPGARRAAAARARSSRAPARRRRPSACASARARSLPLTAAGTSGTPASIAIRAEPERGRCANFLRSPFVWRVPSGNIATMPPFLVISFAVAIASRSPSPRRTGNAPPARRIGPSTGLKSSTFPMKKSCRFGHSGKPSGHGSRLEVWLAARTNPPSGGSRSRPVQREPVQAANHRKGESGDSVVERCWHALVRLRGSTQERLDVGANVSRYAQEARHRRVSGEGENHRRIPRARLHGRVEHRSHPRPAAARLRRPEGGPRALRCPRRCDRRRLHAVLPRRPRQEEGGRGAEEEAEGRGRAPARDGRRPRGRGDRLAPAPGAEAQGADAPDGLPRDHEGRDRGGARKPARRGRGARRLAGDAPNPRPALRLRGLARALEEGDATALGGARAVGGDAARGRARARADAVHRGGVLGHRGRRSTPVRLRRGSSSSRGSGSRRAATSARTGS